MPKELFHFRGLQVMLTDVSSGESFYPRRRGHVWDTAGRRQ